MKTLFLAVMASVALSARAMAQPAPAHAWYMLDAQDATCLLAGPGQSPNDAIRIIRSENIVPTTTINQNTDGSIWSADVNYVGTNGQTVHLLFYTEMAGCQDQLNIEIQRGYIIPPSQLN